VMQTNDPLLKDKRIREAIAASLDYPSMSDSLTDGYAKPSTSLIPLSSRYYGAAEQAGFSLDIARAKKLLADAGYKGEPIKIRCGRPAQLDLRVHFNLATLPAFDGNGTGGCANERNCAGIPQPASVMKRRGARQKWGGWRGRLIFLRRDRRMNVKG